MTGYAVITKTRTRNRTELGLYAEQATSFMAGHDATFLARFGDCEVKEGADVEGVAIIAFPSLGAARDWYESPAYQEASIHRYQGGDYDVVLVDGLNASAQH